MTDPKDLALREAEFLLYQTENGRTRVEVRFDGETAWLSLTQMADLFQRDKSVISRHVKNVFEEGELTRGATVAEFATVHREGNREVTRQVEYYNLDVIISVGYRVKSHRGTQFRIWATQRLREYIVKGFTLDDEQLKRAGGGNYFDELLARIRDILTHAGKVFHDDAVAKAQLDYERFSSERRELLSPGEPHFEEAIDDVKRLEKQRTRSSLEDGKKKRNSWSKGKT